VRESIECNEIKPTALHTPGEPFGSAIWPSQLCKLSMNLWSFAGVTVLLLGGLVLNVGGRLGLVSGRVIHEFVLLLLR
jgi:hypothetical protein